MKKSKKNKSTQALKIAINTQGSYIKVIINNQLLLVQDKKNKKLYLKKIIYKISLLIN